MTDNDIIKALENCKNNGDCKDCILNPHVGNYGYCTSIAIEAALDLINRQKAEIKRSEALVKEIYSLNKELIDDVNNKSKYIYELEDKLKAEKADVMYFKDQIRAEAIKEFAERLKEKSYTPKPYGISGVVDVYEIDRLVKEIMEKYQNEQ